jgi:anhydro-N-acetylmuramic acid kinase
VPQRWIIGLSCGSSGAGIDAALIELRGVGLDVRVQQTVGLHQPHPPELLRLVQLVGGQGEGAAAEVPQASRLHRLLGEASAAAARAVADSAVTSLQKVFCVGCSGHAAGHEPEGRFPATLSLGMAAVVAERTGVTTLSDPSERDLAAGGLGGPLSPLPDWLLFRHPDEGRVVLHLGGLARLTYLPPGGRPPDVIALEAVPCGLLLDGLIRRLTGGREGFDSGGKHAVQGKAIEPLLASWLSDLAEAGAERRPPGGLPRPHLIRLTDELVRRATAHARGAGEVRLHDLLCTATHFVARGIACALRRCLPEGARVDRALLCGGGVRNGLLWHLIGQQLGAPLARTDEAGIMAEQVEAVSTGLLAALTLDGVPGNSPSVTGAAGSRLLGSLTPGSSASWARCVHWMARQLPAPS